MTAEPQPPYVAAVRFDSGLLGPVWRREHAAAGDEALKLANRIARGGDLNLADLGYIQAMAQVAQAHYAAANVRARPS